MLRGYLSDPVVLCFDGETPPAETPPDTTPKSFTQDDVNKILAEDKRKHQAQYTKLEKQLQDTLNTAKLTSDERVKMEESLEDVRKQLRTKEEQARLEKKTLEDQFSVRFKEVEERAVKAESRYVESTLVRALQDAAVVGDAFQPSQIVTLLRPHTKLVDDMPMVDWPTVDETGKPIVMQMTPEETIKRMKQESDRYGNLFKAGVVSGIGGGQGTGSFNSGGGTVDVRRLNMDQYLKLRKENPAALGLKGRK